MRQLFLFSVMAIAMLFASCSKDDGDDTTSGGTSYWSANDLKGHWVSLDGISSYYIDFTADGTFSGSLGRGNEYNYGKYKAANSTNPREIAVCFPKRDADTWYTWTIEWLSSDKKTMQFNTYELKRAD